MNIVFEEGQNLDSGMESMMVEAANACLQYENRDLIEQGKNQLEMDNIEISVTFVSEEEIRSLNKTYRNIDKITDVLSFPQFEDIMDIPNIGIVALGDVVICKQKAEEQAEEFGHSFEREIIYLFVHSCLHLLGYDHMQEEDKLLMRQREEEVMDFIGLKREEKI